jgi:hypothetical protein
VRILRDHAGFTIRLTDERLAHITEHPEMAGLEAAVEETLRNPVFVIQSVSDQTAHLYYRSYSGTRLGDKFVCVVVKRTSTDAFVLTAYLTDRPKKEPCYGPQAHKSLV